MEVHSLIDPGLNVSIALSLMQEQFQDDIVLRRGLIMSQPFVVQDNGKCKSILILLASRALEPNMATLAAIYTHCHLNGDLYMSVHLDCHNRAQNVDVSR